MSDPRVERARVERVRKALISPVYFGEQYMRPFDPNWTSAMPRHGREMLFHALKYDRSVVILPPEFGKTTWISQLLPVWLTITWAAASKVLRGMLLSEEEAMARGNLRVVAWHLVENERVQADFVDTKGRPLIRRNPYEDVWRDDAIIVDRIGASKDPTWVAKGLDSKGIHGRRLDWAIADDIITPAHGESPILRRKAQDKFDLELATRIVKDGHIAAVGNFISPNDLLHDLSGREGWSAIKRPSMHLPGQPDKAPKESQLEDPSIELLWPEVWNRDRLLKTYRESPKRFRRIHLMDERAEGGEKLQESWVTRIAEDETPVDECRFFLGLDTAPGGETEDLDFFVVCVAASLPGQRHLDVVESYSTRTSAGRQASLVGAIHDRWNRVGNGVQSIGVAKVSLDQYFRGALTIVRPDLDGKIEGVSTVGRKEERLEMLGPYAQAGWLRVWDTVWEKHTAAPADVQQEMTLREEWTAFPTGNHDDRLDALDVTIRAARQAAGATTVTWEPQVSA